MRSTPNPSRVRFTGPLTCSAAGLVEDLARLGYTTTSATALVQLAAHFSRWLETEQLELEQVCSEVVQRFLVVRRATYTSHYSLRALQPILNYLRHRGLAPEEEPKSDPSSPMEKLLARYRRHLLEDRGLSHPVADAYVHWVSPFVRGVLYGHPGTAIERLSAEEVSGFLTKQLPPMSKKSAQMTACALRSFLRFLHHENLVEASLADAVPAVAHRRLSGLPQPLDHSQVHSLLGACDRSSAAGRRDYAVITILHRMGLRCGEVCDLELEDVDWNAGVVTIRGKGNRTDRLPLPVDVGEALVDYLRHARPETTVRTVFVQAVAPHAALSRSGLSCIVARAAQRAELGTIHAHRLRHTTASRTLNAGASLEEVSHLLRHASPATTAIYAKTDLTRLATLARPWPADRGVS